MPAGIKPITTTLAMPDYSSTSTQAETDNRATHEILTEKGTMSYACKYRVAKQC
jgi:hypothetical protein